MPAGTSSDAVDQASVFNFISCCLSVGLPFQINSRIWSLEKQRERGEGVAAAVTTVEHLHSRTLFAARNDSSTTSDRGSSASDIAVPATAGDPGRGSSGSIVSDATRAARAQRAALLKPKLAARRNRMTMLRRTPAAHAEALARSNAVGLLTPCHATARLHHMFSSVCSGCLLAELYSLALRSYRQRTVQCSLHAHHVPDF